MPEIELFAETIENENTGGDGPAIVLLVAFAWQPKGTAIPRSRSPCL